MKCWNCHHLNSATDADCFMCGAALHTGTPKVHGSLYAFLALCVFLPVFALAGGTNKVLPLFGVAPVVETGEPGVKVRVKGMRVYRGKLPGNGPVIIPVVLGLLGVGACLYVTRTPFALTTQLILSAVVVLVCWAVYLVAAVALASEQNAAHHAAGGVTTRHVCG